jgi:hypothetical protein
MTNDTQQIAFLSETVVVFLTIFTIINLLADGHMKQRCQCGVTAFCILRIIVAIAILLPEKETEASGNG